MVRSEIFKPGIALKLASLSFSKAKYQAAILGYKAGKYLITEYPTIKGAGVRLEEGSQWEISFVSNGSMVGFSTEVIGVSRHPHPIVFFKYPVTVEEADLRRAKRFPVMLKAVILPKSAEQQQRGEPVVGVVRDISEHGCQIRTASQFNQGDNLELIIELPDKSRLQGLTAEVKNCRPVNGSLLMGISFAAGFMDDGYRQLKDFVEKLESVPLRVTY